MTRDELISKLEPYVPRPFFLESKWQLGCIVDAILEEAAKVAETLSFETGLPGIEREAGGGEVAKAIRALKGNHQ